MACELTAGFALDCKEGVGGIKAIFLQQLVDFQSGVTVDATSEEIDGLPTA